MKTFDIRSLRSPDEQRTFGHGHVDLVKIGDLTVSRATFEPGWRWSNDVAPIAGTRSCQADHRAYVVSGRLHIRTDEGQEGDVGPGDYFVLDPGHDAWTVGDEPCVIFDFAGYEDYARPPRGAGRQPEQPAPGP